MRKLISLRAQKGAVFLLILLIFSFGLLCVGLFPLKTPPSWQREAQTQQALRQASTALIAWSAARGEITGSARPGELPCPDTDPPGHRQYGLQNVPCAAGAIGRLPWRDLGIDELRDGDGEPLWYALDGAFRGGSSNSRPINSDISPALQHHPSPVHPAEAVVAVLLAPGAPLATQQRSSAFHLDRNQYFEAFGPGDNRRQGGPYIGMTALDSASAQPINDRLLAITPQMLFAAVEKRVAGEWRRLLRDYHRKHGRWPAAAPAESLACRRAALVTRIEDGCLPAADRCSGRLPAANLLNYAYDEASASWRLRPQSQRLDVPAWLNVNLWHQVAFYAVDGASLDAASLPDSPLRCRASLRLDTQPRQALLILPGAPAAGSSRRQEPYSAQLADYLTDLANQSAWQASPAISLLTPSRPNFLVGFDPASP